MAYDSTLEGSQIVFQCNPEFVPSQQMMSVCAANGSWTPDPAELECKGIWLYYDCLTISSYVLHVATSPVQLIVEYPSLSMGQ